MYLFKGLKKILEEKLIEYLLDNYPEVLKRRKELRIEEKPSKWYILGAYIGDFSCVKVTSNSVVIQFGSTNYNGLLWAYRIFSSLGDVHIYVKPPHGFGKDILVHLHVTLSRDEYNELLMTKDNIVDLVVKYIRESGNLRALHDLISGLTDAEGDIGYFCHSHYQIYLRIPQMKLETLSKIKDLLDNYGYSAYIVLARGSKNIIQAHHI